MVICARCNKTVYFNEEKRAIDKSFHVSCFVCGNMMPLVYSHDFYLFLFFFIICAANQDCKRRLDSGSLTEHDDEIYCKQCYGRLFGPKGLALFLSRKLKFLIRNILYQIWLRSRCWNTFNGDSLKERWRSANV